MGRTLRWFWPRAESGIYAEARRLADDGLASARAVPAADGSRRTRTVYKLTARGRTALRSWLATPGGSMQMFIEPFLRLHLARAGSLDQLRASIAAGEATADELLRTAVAVAQEFLAGTHSFQDDLALRGLLFEGLWAQGLALKQWAIDVQAELARWADLDGDQTARHRARAAMTAALTRAEQLELT
jgi:DNA-binding PadR family transcriptional regulator